MQRIFAAFLVAALLLPSMAMMSPTSRAACCCNTSGSCPLKKHAGCEKSCSMDRSDATPASSFRAPQLLRDPAVFATAPIELATSSTEFIADFAAVPLHRTTPPALPPPRA